MKVSGVGSGAPASGSRRTEKSTGKGEFKATLLDSMGGADEPAPVETTSGIGAVDALLIVQSVGDAEEREARKRLIQRGEDILDQLEEIRHGLLMGSIPKDKLETLAQTVRNRREACADPRLAAVLDEIELRAEVELAKLSRAG